MKGGDNDAAAINKESYHEICPIFTRHFTEQWAKTMATFSKHWKDTLIQKFLHL